MSYSREPFKIKKGGAGKEIVEVLIREQQELVTSVPVVDETNIRRIDSDRVMIWYSCYRRHTQEQVLVASRSMSSQILESLFDEFRNKLSVHPFIPP